MNAKFEACKPKILEALHWYYPRTFTFDQNNNVLQNGQMIKDLHWKIKIEQIINRVINEN